MAGKPNQFEGLFRRGLIVSCQAPEGDPMSPTEMLVAMAKSAMIGGAVGLRVNGPAVTSAVRWALPNPLPIIGIFKQKMPDGSIFITPNYEDAVIIAHAGAQCVAIDATSRPRPDGTPLKNFITRIHRELGACVMADVSTYDEGIEAAKAGADCVATTLSGYTPQSKKSEGPDLDLVRRLSAKLKVPVVAEGRYNTPEEAAAALEAGAYAVVVGTAITNPTVLTRRFALATGKVLNEIS